MGGYKDGSIDKDDIGREGVPSLLCRSPMIFTEHWFLTSAKLGCGTWPTQAIPST